MKIASLLFIPALLLSGLTARAGLPASFKERLAEASRENRTIQCDFTQRKQWLLFARLPLGLQSS